MAPQVKPVKVMRALAAPLLTLAPLDNPAVTAAIDVKEATKLRLKAEFVRVAATDVIFTFEEADDGATWIPIMDPDAPTALVPLTVTRTTSVTGNFSFAVDVSPYKNVRASAIGTSAGVTDTLSLTGTIVRS